MPWECWPTYEQPSGGLGSGDATKWGLRLLPAAVAGVRQPMMELLELVAWPCDTTWPVGWWVGWINGTTLLLLLLYLANWPVFKTTAALKLIGFWKPTTYTTLDAYSTAVINFHSFIRSFMYSPEIQFTIATININRATVKIYKTSKKQWQKSQHLRQKNTHFTSRQG